MILGVFLVVTGWWILVKNRSSQELVLAELWKKNEEKSGFLTLPTTTPEPSLMPTLIPTPTPISFEEMNRMYGPCVRINVLMYHHIQPEEEAKTKNQSSLTVTPDFFRQHLQYLKDRNYSIITGKDLIDFFNGNKTLSGKLAMITLDDGYQDNYKYAFPILKELGVKATVFASTGLMNNPDYLTWEEIKEMNGVIYFGNHTWSHHSAAGSREEEEKEISLADGQLSEKGLNEYKVFAYPYGKTNVDAINILETKSYNLAFTTKSGNIMCKAKSLELPRIRVGGVLLSNYGL